jgi:hypothetical protein
MRTGCAAIAPRPAVTSAGSRRSAAAHLTDEQIEPLAEVVRGSLTGLAPWWLDHPHVERQILVDTMLSVLTGRSHNTLRLTGNCADLQECGVRSRGELGWTTVIVNCLYGETYMATADFLDEKRHEIGARLKELKPLVDEYQRLEAAAAALDGVPATPLTSSTSPATRRAPARTTAARKRGASHSGRRGRPKGSGTRGAEALALVRSTPGITIPEIAAKMGIKQNYLYRVLPGLAEDGLVVKDGRGWKPKDAA